MIGKKLNTVSELLQKKEVIELINKLHTEDKMKYTKIVNILNEKYASHFHPRIIKTTMNSFTKRGYTLPENFINLDNGQIEYTKPILVKNYHVAKLLNIDTKRKQKPHRHI